MKLDERITKHPFNPLDVDEAKHFIGKPGYFAQNYSQFRNLSLSNYVTKGILSKIDYNSDYAYECKDKNYYTFFMPSEFVKDIRPLKLDELLNIWETGHTYRLKKADNKMITTADDIIEALFYGYTSNIDDNYVQLKIGSIICAKSLNELSEYKYLIETKDRYEWKLLGVKYETGK